MFVVKDGTIGIGSVAPSPSLASGSRGGVAIAGSALSVIDPDTEDPNLDQAEDAASDQSDVEEEDMTRSNRFQLNPSRVNDILAEAERSRSGSPSSSVYGGPRKLRKPGREVAIRLSDEPRDGAVLTWDGWKRSLRADMGCVMRRRAEEGYNLSNVSVQVGTTAHRKLLLNAAIATRFPGHDRIAGIWEFVERE